MLVSGPYKETKKQPRYLKQRDKYSCGAIALLNALKWAGYQINYRRDFGRAYRACKCNKDGVYTNNFDTAIRRYKKLIVLPECESFEAPPIKLIDECLENHGAIAMAYIYKYNGHVEVSHMTLCIGRKGNQYVFVNNARQAKKAITLHKRSTVVKMLRFRDPYCGGCEVWFLNKLLNKIQR
jgi:hypothetical protein